RFLLFALPELMTVEQVLSMCYSKGRLNDHC
ncbi:MAG: hypothetical protein ACJAUZ_001996, partial [Flavobacteriaceae bacterium]